MNKRSAVLMAAGLVGSLVMGVLAFALGALGPVASAAGPKLNDHRQRPAHTAQRKVSNGGPAVATGAVGGTSFVPAATTPATGPNQDGTGDGSDPSEDPSPEPSQVPEPSPEPSEVPEPSPTGGPESEDPPPPPPSPSPSGEPGDDGSGDD